MQQDAAFLAQMMHDAVHAVPSTDYTLAQRTAWSPSPMSASRFHARVSDGRDVFVAHDRIDGPVGFIELLSDGEIDCFYRAPHAAGTGLGQALYDALHATALSCGMAELRVNASEGARRFFLRQGFQLGARQTLIRAGIVLHNYRMQKSLTP